MLQLRFRRFAAALLLVLLGAGATPSTFAQSSPSAQVPYPAKPAAAPALKLDPGAVGATRIELPAMDPAAIDAVKRANTRVVNKRLQIGIGQKVPASAVSSSTALRWTPVAGGMAAQWEVTSPGARALRVGFAVSQLPVGAEIRFAGRGDPGVVYGPYAARDVRLTGSTYWSPSLEGDHAIAEVFLAAGTSPSNLALEVTQASNLFVSPSDPKAEIAAKAAGACEVNLICRSATDAALANTGRAVARMTFSEGGASFVCTGTLLNPADGTFTPYFYSAAHCIDTQEVASTLTTYWFYESTSCGSSPLNPAAVQVGGGATLLFASEATDAMLLRLNSPPPGGAVFAAWNADTLPVGAALTAIHHPDGDVKKVSLGTVGGFGSATPGGASFTIARWNSIATGVTEGGSSGSGIFTAIGVPASSYQFRGGLFGGPSSCSAAPSDLIDYYSRFDQVYPYLAVHLNPAGTSCNYTLPISSRTASGSGGSGSFGVATQPTCPWAATSTASWIRTSSTGSGSASASYTVDANDGNATRTGTVIVAGRTFTVTQPVQPGTGVNVVSNGGFESGTASWLESSTANLPIITTGSTAFAGNGYAWLGGYESGTDTITQTVAIPANAARASLSFWYRIDTEENTTNIRDSMSVALLNAGGGTLATLASFSNLDDTGGQWVRSQAIDVSAFRGQSVRLRFSIANDAAGTSSFLVDSVALSAVAANYTSLWWNPNESGWGINLVHQGDILFGTLFTYDANGQGMWLVMSNGVKQAGSETYTGELYRTTGPAFNANPFTPITLNANYTRVGTMTVAFSGSNGAALAYSVNGANVTKSIQRLVFGAQAADCEPTTSPRTGLTNYQDLWWNAAESGWGINLTHQGDVIFATLFTYDNAVPGTNAGLWLVMSAGAKQADGSYLGNLYRTVGPAFNADPFTPIGSGNYTLVGTMRLSFPDGAHGNLEYSVNGAPVTKAITRLEFSSPVPACSG